MSPRMVGAATALAAAVSIPPLSGGPQQPLAAQGPVVLAEPATRLEAFLVRTGVVMVCGSSRFGAVRAEPGALIAVATKELTDATSGERALGVAVEVRRTEHPEPDRVSYVDFEELPSLLAGLEYLAKVERTATTLDRLEAHYLTRGGLLVTVFSTSTGMKAAVSSGLAGSAATELEYGEFQRLRQLLQSAYESLKTL